MAKKGDTTKGKPPVVDHNKFGKRFTNGHKTFTSAEAAFMGEIYSKNDAVRVAFLDTYHLLKKPRNPTTGELTSREDAEYLVPLSTVAEKAAVKTKPAAEELGATESKIQGMSMFNKLMREMERCESLRQRREKLNAEVDMVAAIMQHKQVCASAGWTGPIHRKGELMTKTPEQLAQSSRPY